MENKITSREEYYKNHLIKDDETNNIKWYNLFDDVTDPNNTYQINEKGCIRYYYNGMFCVLGVINENGKLKVDILNDNMELVRYNIKDLYIDVFGQFPPSSKMAHLNFEEIAKKIPLDLQKQTYDDILIINNISPKEQKVVCISLSLGIIKTLFKPYINKYNKSEQIYICERFLNLCIKKIFEGEKLERNYKLAVPTPPISPNDYNFELDSPF